MFTSTKDDVVSDLKSGAASLSRDARNTANNVKNDIRSGMREANDTRADWESSAHEFGAQARDCLNQATRELRDTTSEIRGRITRNPVESSVVALAVGFLLGQLFRR